MENAEALDVSKDALGDRMKAYERVETARTLDVHSPVIVRIDGRGFSRFTRGFERPFDARMTAAMIATTSALVERTHALVGYTQSDEITLIYQAAEGGDILFSGKVQKLTSVLAGLATAAFCREIASTFPPEISDRLPHFDARAFNVPDRAEAANCLLWRIRDAEKNAVSMACASHFSHRAMHLKNGVDKRAMLATAGVDFDEYPASFRVGTMLKRHVVTRPLSDDERMRIPEPHRPALGLEVQRTDIRSVTMPESIDYAWVSQAAFGPNSA